MYVGDLWFSRLMMERYMSSLVLTDRVAEKSAQGGRRCHVCIYVSVSNLLLSLRLILTHVGT